MLRRSTLNLLTDRLWFNRYCQPIVLLSLVVVFGLPSLDSTSFTAASSCVAQNPPASREYQPDLTKAMKYHSALLSRPNPGYLYDRFYNAWLDAASMEELREFLVKRANAPASKVADRLLLAFCYAKQGKDVEALQQFREALKKDPDNVATRYEMAIIQARTLDFESALKNLGKAAKNNPAADEGIKIAQLRGKLLARNRQAEEAVQVWDELVQNNPDDLGLMEDLIELQISEGMLKQAEALSDRLIAKTNDPFQKVIRQMRKGDLLQRGGNGSKALDVYGNTLAQVGMDSWLERELLSHVEQVFRGEDDLVGLNLHLVKLGEANARRVAIKKTQAKILMELGRANEAIEVFEKVVELTPGSRENREAFASLLIRTGNADRAVKQMKALIAQHPQDAELQVRLAELCHQDSEPQKAKAALDRFVSLSGGTEYSYLRAAQLFEKFADLDNVKAAYITALEKFQDSDSVKESWADFLYRSGSKDEAVEIWQALAEGTDRAGLVRLARMVGARKMHQIALDMLLSGYDEFRLDSIYLGQLCAEAIDLKRFPESVGWATERVRLAKTSVDVDTTLPPAILIIEAAKETEGVLQSLRNKKTRSTAETCLLIEMLDRSSLEDEAESILQASVEASKAAKNNDDLLILANQRVRLALGRRNWRAAAEAARDLLDLPGGRKSPNVQQLIELYMRIGKKESALKWIAEWKRLSPSSWSPWLKEVTLLERSGKTAESIAVLRRAALTFPDNKDLWERLADKYISNGQTENAKRIFWRQYDDSEKLSDKIRWAEQLARVADYDLEIDQLVKRFEERHKNNPRSIAPLLSIARAHRIAGNYEEQRDALLTATRLKKDDLSLLLAIARLEESEGDWEKAIQTLERASEFDKTNQAKQRMAQLYFQYGDTKEGVARLLEIAGGVNATAENIEKISQTMLKTQEWEELLNFLTPHLVRFPNNYRLSFLSAIANEELGNTDAAKDQFLQLLQAHQELPVVASQIKRTKSKVLQKLNRQRGSMPASAFRLLRLPEIFYSAYSYLPGPAGIARPAKGACVPIDLESCHEYALRHLCEIGRELSEDARNRLQGELELAGVENTKLLMANLTQDVIQNNPMMLLEIDPDSEAALAIAVLNIVRRKAAQFQEAELPQAVCLKAYEQFKDSFPGISFFAAVQLDQTKPENQTRLAKAVKRLKSIEKPDYLVFDFIATGSYRSSLDEHRTELAQLAVEWYPELAKSPQLSDWAFRTAANALLQSESYQHWIDFLDKELDGHRGQNNQRQARFNFHGRLKSQTQVIELPTYPPEELIYFPASIYDLLDLPEPVEFDEDEDFGTQNEISEEELELLRDFTAITVSTARDPILKVLLELQYFHYNNLVKRNQKTEGAKPIAPFPDSVKAAFGDQVTDAKSAIDQLLKASEENVDAWYLAGSLAVKEKRWNDAVTNFEAMRELPMTAEARRKIDGHLVALVTPDLIKDLNNDAYASVLTSAKAAALRLRRGTLSNDQRVELVSFLRFLDLNDEADQLSKILRNSAVVYQKPNPSSYERIENLVVAGQLDAAARLLANQFRRIARSELNAKLSRVTNGQYELHQFQQQVQLFDLKDQLLKQLNPGGFSNARKLSTWAYAQEVFGEKEVAESVYEKLLKAYPIESAARLRYMMLNPAGERQSFRLQFPKIPKRLRAQFLASMFQQTTDGKISAKALLSLAESIIVYKESDSGDSIDDGSLKILLTMLGSEMSVSTKVYGFNLPPIDAKAYELKSPATGANASRLEKEAAALVKRKRVLHDRVALALTDSQVPGQAAEAFTALLASREAVGKPIDDKIVELALKTIYPVKKSRGHSQVAQTRNQLQMSWSRGSNAGYYFVVKRTPVEFLSRHYGLSKVSHDQQIESIAAKLDSLNAKDDATKLRMTYALCRASEDEFPGVVEGLVGAAKGTASRPNHALWSEVLSQAVEIWKERNLQADISQSIIAYAASKPYSSTGGYAHSESLYPSKNEPLADYLSELAWVRDLSQAEEFLEKLRLETIGSEEEQHKLAKLLVDQDTIQKNWDRVGPAVMYRFLVRSLINPSRSPKPFWLGVNERRRFPLPGQDESDLPRELLQAIAKFKVDQADSMLQWFKQSSVLNGVSSFDPYYPADENAKSSAWGNVLGDVTEQKIDYKLKVMLRKKLSSQSERTFGENLLLAYVAKRPINIYQLLGSEIDRFSALPEDQQNRLARFAREVNDNNIKQFGKHRAASLSVSEESKAAKRICWRSQVENVKSEFAKLMQAKSLASLGVEESEFEAWAKNLLESMNGLPPQELLAVVSKLARFSSEEKIAARFYAQNINIKSQLIEGVIGTRVDTDSVKLVLASLDDSDMLDVRFSESLSSYIGNFFSLQFGAAKAELKKQDGNLSATAAAVKAMKILIAQLGDEYGDRDFAVLIPELHYVCLTLKDAEAEAIGRWLHSREEVKYPEIKNAFRLAFDCSRDIENQPTRDTQADLPRSRPAHTKSNFEEVLKYVDDDSNPLQARSRLAAYLTKYNGLSGEGVLACGRVIAKAYDEGQVSKSWQNKRMFLALMESAGAPESKEAMIAFANSWTQSLKKRGLTPQQDNLRYCLEVLGMTEDEAQVKKLLEDSNVKSHSWLAITLIELGYFDKAEKQLEAAWSQNYWLPSEMFGEVFYTSQLESELSAFTEQLEGDGRKYFAELYLASLKNSPAERTVTTTPQSRLAALADRFPNINFNSDRDRQQSLILLSPIYSKAKVLDDAVTREVKDLSIETILNTAEPGLNVKLLGAYFSTQIQLQNFKPVQAKWKEINRLIKARPDDYRGARKLAFQQLASTTCNSFYRLMRDQNPEQIANLLPVLRDLNNPSYELHINPNTTQIAHLIAGRSGELAKFMRKKRVEVRFDSEAPMNSSQVFREFISNLNVQFKKIHPTNSEARTSFVSNTWRLAKSQGYLFPATAKDPEPKQTGVGSGLLSGLGKMTKLSILASESPEGIEQIAALGILTDEQILEVGPELARIQSGNGLIWLQLARRQARAGHNLEATDSFKKSIEETTDDMKTAKFNRQVECARTLVEMNRNEEARALIEDVPVKKLTSPNKKTLNKLKKKLSDSQ